MKNILALSLFLIFYSCGRPSAEKRSSESGYIEITNRLNFFNSDLKAKSQLRGSSLLVYPITSDNLENWGYTPEEENFNQVFERLSYRSKIPTVIEQNISNDKKIEKIVSIIHGASFSQDKAFLAYSNVARKLSPLLEDRREVIESFPCFEYRNDENKRRCNVRRSSRTSSKPKRVRSCKNFEKNFTLFTDLSIEEAESYERAIVECADLDKVIWPLQKKRKIKKKVL